MELHLCSSPFRVHLLPPGSIMLRIDWFPTYLPFGFTPAISDQVMFLYIRFIHNFPSHAQPSTYMYLTDLFVYSRERYLTFQKHPNPPFTSSVLSYIYLSIYLSAGSGAKASSFIYTYLLVRLKRG